MPELPVSFTTWETAAQLVMKCAENETLRASLTEAEARAERLQAIQEITDVALGTLQLDRMLEVLLGRLRKVLAVDSSTVLLLTPSGRTLVPRASNGLTLEEDVRIPIGKGFAGWVAKERRPIAVRDVRELEVHRPQIASDMRSLLGVPLVVGSRVVGVLHVGTRTERIFTREDELFLQLVAERAGAAIDRVRTLDALQESSRFRTLASLAPVGIFQTDAGRACTFVNDGWCQMTGLTPEEAEGLGWNRAIHPDDRPRVVRERMQADRKHREYVSQYRLEKASGEIVWVQENARPFRDASGVVCGYIGTVTDVSEEKRRSERWAALARASGTLTTTLDYEATIENVMNTLLPVLGDFGFVDLVENGRVRRIARAPDDPARQALLEQTEWRRLEHPELDLCALSTGRAARHPHIDDAWLEQAFRSNDLRQVMQELGVRSMISVPILFRKRRLGALTVFRAEGYAPFAEDDLLLAQELANRAASALENARLYEELRTAYEAAREADRKKDEFLAILGHELRNPLAPITTAIDLIQMRDDGRFGREVDVLRRQVHHMVRLVDDLLDVSRFMRGKIELSREFVELPGVVERALELVDPILERRKNVVTRDLATDGAMVFADRDRIAQVLANLLTNASKYSEPGSRIWIRSRVVADRVLVEIEDQGIGIDADLLPRVFELFAQGDQPLDRSRGGLGLGLAIVKSLVELHGGSVQVKSEGPGRGSVFGMSLPLAAPTTDDLMPQESAFACPVNARRRVLIVDDNRDAALMLEDVLSSLGHVTEIAHDGPQALSVLPSFEPEVVLLDIGLPVMSGYEVATRIRESVGEDVRLIAVSGYGQAKDMAQSKAAGFEDHLTKPVDLERLVGLLF